MLATFHARVLWPTVGMMLLTSSLLPVQCFVVLRGRAAASTTLFRRQSCQAAALIAHLRRITRRTPRHDLLVTTGMPISRAGVRFRNIETGMPSA